MNGQVKWKWNVREFRSETERELKNRCTMAGLALRNKHRKNLNVPYPRASVPGEYPRRRTGRLRDGVLFELKVRDRETITVSVRETTYYWVFLYASGRLTLWHTMLAMKVQLKKIMLSGKLK